jgi:hypothetical protein
MFCRLGQGVAATQHPRAELAMLRRAETLDPTYTLVTRAKSPLLGEAGFYRSGYLRAARSDVAAGAEVLVEE